MNAKLKIGLSLILLNTANSFSFEVNTHQAITRCATQSIQGLQLNQCAKQGAVNLHKFAENSLLDKESYEREIFDKYGRTYFDYAKEGKGFKAWNIIIPNTNYQALIEAGVVLEDAVYHNADIIALGGDGRFNNHFYSAQTPTTKGPLMQTNRALSTGYGQRTDNITWVLDKSVDLGHNRINDYNLYKSFEYFKKSFIGSLKERKTAQAKLFVSLGFMIHMIQDLHSPAHVRDGSHPLGDYLEIYGRYNGGFNLRAGSFNSNNNQQIFNAIKAIDMKDIMLTKNNYSSYQDFFTHEANWISKNFFSEAHNDFTKANNNETGEGLDLDTSTDKDTIFDSHNPKLSKTDTFEQVIPNSDTAVIGDLWNYIKTNGNVATVKGDISTSHNVVGIVEHGYLFNSERMLAVVDGSSNTGYNDYDKTPLSDTAINVIPRAVVSSEAFINYFFRGRMEATLSDDNKNITIKNISDPQWVSNPDLCTFKSTMTVDIYYINDKNVSKTLFSRQALGEDLDIGDTLSIDIGDRIKNLSDIGDEKKIIVLLDGQLGEKRGLDEYSNNARGLVVAYASSRVANADILFSFDKSGSMGSDIENAKTSAKSILTNVVGADNNSTYMQVEAFNGGASVLLAYDNNVTKVKAKIDTIFSGGGTALYDAIKLAGNSAVAHKNTNNTPKSIVILYTDGQENSSSTTRQEAIDAISNANASEIDEVFLIFVGSGSGSSALQSIANEAGRKFLSVTNGAGLEDAISKILRGQ